MKARSVWLAWWWAWAIPGALLAANLIWLAGVRGALVGRGSLVGRRVAEMERDVSRLETEKRRLEETSQRLTALRTDLTSLRQEQLASMRDRLVPFLIDVVDRARRVGLPPERIAYQAALDKKTGLAHFIATYSLTGRYDQIRELIYLLESSPQFIVIESLGLSGGDDPASLDVQVRLALGTYFSDIDEELLRELGVSEVRGGE